MTEIFDKVFLGDNYTAQNAYLLKRLNIGHILNVTDTLKNYFDKKTNVQVKVYKQTQKNAVVASSPLTGKDDSNLHEDTCAQKPERKLPFFHLDSLFEGHESPSSPISEDHNYIEDERTHDEIEQSPEEEISALSPQPNSSIEDSQIMQVMDSNNTSDEIIVSITSEKDDVILGPDIRVSNKKKKRNSTPKKRNYDIYEVTFEEPIEYKRISIKDSWDNDLKQYFEEGAEFIHKCVQSDSGKNCLVHCREARSRSVCILIAYAMKKLQWSLERAYNHIHELRNGQTRINDGFKRQLMAYELELIKERQVNDDKEVTNTLNFFQREPRRRPNPIYQDQAENELDVPKKTQNKTKVEMDPTFASVFTRQPKAQVPPQFEPRSLSQFIVPKNMNGVDPIKELLLGMANNKSHLSYTPSTPNTPTKRITTMFKSSPVKIAPREVKQQSWSETIVSNSDDIHLSPIPSVQVKNKRKSTVGNDSESSPKKLRLNDAIINDQNSGSTEASQSNLMSDWSDARKKLYEKIHTNPNAYYHKYTEPNEQVINGKWSEEEKQNFLKRYHEFGHNADKPQWGTFSMTIPGRTGLQCSTFFKKLIKSGEINNPRYYVDETGEVRKKEGPNAKKTTGPFQASAPLAQTVPVITWNEVKSVTEESEQDIPTLESLEMMVSKLELPLHSSHEPSKMNRSNDTDNPTSNTVVWHWVEQ